MKGKAIRLLARETFAETCCAASHYDVCMAYCKSHGWRVVMIGDGGTGDKIIDFLGLSEYAKNKQAFAYRNLMSQIIAVDSKIRPRRRAYYIAHELGHILLEHDLDNLSPDDEQEANRFADAFMRCPVGGRHTRMMRMAALLCVALCTACYLLGHYTQTASSAAYPVSVPVASLPPSADRNQIVYITSSGERYHRADCPHIRGRAAITTTLAEAETLGLDPCKSCQPDRA